MKRFRIVALFFWSAAACAQTDYPESWGGMYLGEGKNCPSLSGTYEYVGEDTAQVQMFPPTVAVTVFSRNQVSGDATAIRIVHDPAKGLLTGTILGKNLKGVPTFTVKVGCRDGWVTFEENKNEIVDGNLSAIKSTRFMAQSGDGALVVNHVYKVDRPYFFSMFHDLRQSTTWYRFKGVEE